MSITHGVLECDNGLFRCLKQEVKDRRLCFYVSVKVSVIE